MQNRVILSVSKGCSSLLWKYSILFPPTADKISTRPCSQVRILPFHPREIASSCELYLTGLRPFGRPYFFRRMASLLAPLGTRPAKRGKLQTGVTRYPAPRVMATSFDAYHMGESSDFPLPILPTEGAAKSSILSEAKDSSSTSSECSILYSPTVNKIGSDHPAQRIYNSIETAIRTVFSGKKSLLPRKRRACRQILPISQAHRAPASAA